jgi:hypothetical protein
MGPDEIPACFRIEHDAEYTTLLLTQGALEPQLFGELIRPDYLERVETARRKIVERWGEWGI